MKSLFANTMILIMSVGSAHAATISFQDVTYDIGINIVNPSFGNPSIADYDKDGYLDIYVGGHGKNDTLLNRGIGSTYTNLIAQTGIDPKGDQHGIAWGDYDRDGDLDLYISMGGGRGASGCLKTDKFYTNNGDGTFTDVTVAAGVQNECGRGRGINFIDYNNDGWLDIFLANYLTDNVLYRNKGDGTFEDVSVASGLNNIEGSISSWSDVDNDGDPDIVIVGSGGDTLVINNGDGTFMKSTLSGLLNIQRSGAMTWGDYDLDGDEDLFITHKYSFKVRQLFSDANEIRFSDKLIGENGIDFQYTGNIVKFDLYYKKDRQIALVNIGAAGDQPEALPVRVDQLDAEGKPVYDVNVDLGFYIWQDFAGWHLRWVSPIKAKLSYGVIQPGDAGQFSQVIMTPFAAKEPPNIKSVLYRNDGEGHFTDVTDQAGVANTKNNTSATWGDFDNDGDLDLYLVNANDFRYNGPNSLFLNNGEGTFSDVSAASQAEVDVLGRGEGCVAADLDNDGYLDLYITNGMELPVYQRPNGAQTLTYGPNVVLSNRGGDYHWLKLVLKGSESNLDGIGANVCVTTGLKTLCDQYFGSYSDLYSQSVLPMHFGLGSALVADQIKIVWPSGKQQILNDIAADTLLTLEEAEASRHAIPIPPVVIPTNASWDGYIKDSGQVYDNGLNMRVGDGKTEQTFRSFMGFDLSQAPSEETLVKATLSIKHLAKQGDPSLLGTFILDSIDFGDGLDALDFSSDALLTKSISSQTFSANGWIDLDITEHVQADLEAGRSYSHIRLRPEQLSSNSQADLIRFATSEAGDPATLTLEYTRFIQHNILTSPEQDGTIIDGKRPITGSHVVYVGVNTSGEEQRSYFGFDLLSLPSEEVLYSAKLHFFVKSKSGDILQLGDLLLDHINFGDSLETIDFDVMGSMDINRMPMTMTKGSWLVLDVSDAVASDILQLSPRSQFRLRSENAPLDEKRNIRINTWESGENQPFLEINFISSDNF